MKKPRVYVEYKEKFGKISFASRALAAARIYERIVLEGKRNLPSMAYERPEGGDISNYLRVTVAVGCMGEVYVSIRKT